MICEWYNGVLTVIFCFFVILCLDPGKLKRKEEGKVKISTIRVYFCSLSFKFNLSQTSDETKHIYKQLIFSDG